MSKLLTSIDLRTNLVGENRLELLLFQLGSRHIFALNVFKIREVITLPQMNQLPGAHSHVKGVINNRGKSIPVIDLRSAIRSSHSDTDYENPNVIVTEYNRSVQGFLIGDIIRIINTCWDNIQPPPKATGKQHYLTAITRVKIDNDEKLVEIIDVEKVLAEIIDYDVTISQGILDETVADHLQGKVVLVVDDSPVARQQTKGALAQLGITTIEKENGREALNYLLSLIDEGKDPNHELLMIFTDAEMPEMDGYRLTSEIRSNNNLCTLFVALNTSLSGNFNEAMVEKVGCDRFISKFQPDMLVTVVQDRMRDVLERQ